MTDEAGVTTEDGSGDAQATRATPGCVLVRVAGHELRVPLASVREVQRCPTLAPVPGARDWLVGATAWQGRALAVIDMARLAFASEGDGGGALLICTHDEAMVGLRVDAVLESLPAHDGDDAPQSHWLAEADADGRRRLDVAALLGDESLRDAGRWPRARRSPPGTITQENAHGR